MSTRAIKRKRDEGLLAGDWQPPRETAPSVLRTDQPAISRYIGMAALLPAAAGALALIAYAGFGRTTLLGVGGGFFALAVGIAGLLFHAFNEKDLQLRRVYGLLGGALLAAGVLFRLLPFEGVMGGRFLAAGAPCLALALLFLLSFARNETEAWLRDKTVTVLGIVGAIMALIGFIGGLASDNFLMTHGVVMLLLGLLYVAAYVGMQPAGSERGYWAGIALGVLGALMEVVAVGYWLWPSTFGQLLLPDLFNNFVGWQVGQPGPPFLFIYLGLEYLLLALGICSDAKLAVLTRRELAAMFYSPIAYILLICLTFLGWLSYLLFVSGLVARSQGNEFGGPPTGTIEPIVANYVLTWIPVVSVIFVVPVLTMRLLSDEKRSGTLEMLLTAPVNETTVVLSKFLAVLRFWLLAWYPWGLYLLALRIEGQEPFDYRPLLSFAIVLVVTGMGFLSMGLFFSGLTRSQIVAAVLTFVGMLMLFAVFFIRGQLEGSIWSNVLNYVSYIDLWINSLLGTMAPRYLLFHLSATVFWLFLTVKVLEARKWT